MNIKDLPQGSYKVITPPAQRPGLMNIKDLPAGSYRVVNESQSSPAPAEQEQDGFIRSVLKDIANPFVRAGVSGYNALQGKPLETPRNVPVFGKAEGYEQIIKEGGLISPEGKLQNPINVKGLKQAVGAGASIGSNLVGGQGAGSLVKSGLKTTLGTTIKRGAMEGFKAGSLHGAGSALQDDKGAGEVVAQSLGEGVLGAAGGATLAGVGVGIPKAVGSRSSKLAEQSAELSVGSSSSKIATKKLDTTGRVVKDKTAAEVVRQGISEADTALIKTGSKTDKSKMAKMLDVREKAMDDKLYGATNRATDVVGDTFVENIVKPIEKLNKEAGKKLDVVAQKLSGKTADATSAINELAADLEKEGIRVMKNMSLNFRGSSFEGLRSVQKDIIDVWTRALRIAKKRDALDMHRTKRFLDQKVEYGAEGEGLRGTAANILKKFRHNIDSSLDATFPTYNKVNTQFSETIQQLNNLAVTIGKRFRAGDTFADAQAGTALRRLFSNTNSRTDQLKMLQGMQDVLKKYGIRIDEDVIRQAQFADLLEKEFGTEATTSMMGQVQRGVEEVASPVADIFSGHPIRGGFRVAKSAVEAMRGINQKNRLKALRELLKEGQEKGGTNLGTSSKSRSSLGTPSVVQYYEKGGRNLMEFENSDLTLPELRRKLEIAIEGNEDDDLIAIIKSDIRKRTK